MGSMNKITAFINPLPWSLWDSKESIECTLQNPGESSRSTRYFFTYRLSNTMNFEHDTVVCVLCSRKVFDFRHSICLTSFFTHLFVHPQGGNTEPTHHFRKGGVVYTHGWDEAKVKIVIAHST